MVVVWFLLGISLQKIFNKVMYFELLHGLGLQQDLVPGLGRKHIQAASGWGVIISHCNMGQEAFAWEVETKAFKFK